MNRKRKTDLYDRIAVGNRIQTKRQLLEISQEELAERIDRAPKYCSDIERGICGMSIETLLTFAKELNMSLDYMIYGETPEDEQKKHTDAFLAISHALSEYPEETRVYAIKMLSLLLAAIKTDVTA